MITRRQRIDGEFRGALVLLDVDGRRYRRFKNFTTEVAWTAEWEFPGYLSQEFLDWLPEQ